jgi:flavin reductase (DIM6/NTAB) family NADH-FMN oxidoreductase RutF
MLGFTSSGIKDTLINCQDTGQFVFNVVSHNLLEAMNLTSAALAADHNEFEYAHLGQVPSVRVRPSRVEGTPAALECKVVDIFRLKDLDGKETNSWFTIGQVVGVFIDPAYITSQGRFDTAKAQIPGRCGYFDYSSSDRIFELLRP